MGKILDKRKKFAKNIVKTNGNAKAAYLLSNPHVSDGVARLGGHRMMQREDVRALVIKELERQGMDIVFFNNKLRDLVGAKKSLVTKDGLVEVEDNGVQLSALKLGYELIGATNSKIDASVNLQQVNYSNIDVQKLEVTLEKMNQLTAQMADFDEQDS